MFAILLIGYWACLSLIPVPGLGHASFARGENWSDYFDINYLPGAKYDGSSEPGGPRWDPEGPLSTPPAVASCLLGVFAALLLRNQKLSEGVKVCGLLGGGVLCLALGYAWGLQFPVIKKIWTSSFVLVAGGYSCILLGLFYLLIDVWKLRWWTLPFVWIGTNAITMYLLAHVVSYEAIAQRLVGGSVQASFAPAVGQLLISTVAMLLMLALARFLYRHNIFLRV